MNRISIGSRTIVPVGRGRKIGPKRPRTSLRGFGKELWAAPVVSATIVIGQQKGHEPRNRSGRCSAVPEKINAAAIDRAFVRMRSAQVGDRNVGATRFHNRGWYQNRPEQSLSYQIFFDPSVAGEKDVKAFTAHVRTIAEDFADRFCQDSVLLVVENGARKRVAGYDGQDAPRKRRR